METKSDCIRGGWCCNEVVRPFGMGVWKNIRRGWGVFFLDLSYMRWETGLRLRFWLDLWCKNHPLKAIFRNCLVSLAIKRLGWQIICGF